MNVTSNPVVEEQVIFSFVSEEKDLLEVRHFEILNWCPRCDYCVTVVINGFKYCYGCNEDAIYEDFGEFGDSVVGYICDLTRECEAEDHQREDAFAKMMGCTCIYDELDVCAKCYPADHAEYMSALSECYTVGEIDMLKSNYRHRSRAYNQGTRRTTKLIDSKYITGLKTEPVVESNPIVESKPVELPLAPMPLLESYRPTPKKTKPELWCYETEPVDETETEAVDSEDEPAALDETYALDETELKMGYVVEIEPMSAAQEQEMVEELDFMFYNSPDYYSDEEDEYRQTEADVLDETELKMGHVVEIEPLSAEEEQRLIEEMDYCFYNSADYLSDEDEDLKPIPYYETKIYQSYYTTDEDEPVSTAEEQQTDQDVVEVESVSTAEEQQMDEDVVEDERHDTATPVTASQISSLWDDVVEVEVERHDTATPVTASQISSLWDDVVEVEVERHDTATPVTASQISSLWDDVPSTKITSSIRGVEKAKAKSSRRAKNKHAKQMKQFKKEQEAKAKREEHIRKSIPLPIMWITPTPTKPVVAQPAPTEDSRPEPQMEETPSLKKRIEELRKQGKTVVQLESILRKKTKAFNKSNLVGAFRDWRTGTKKSLFDGAHNTTLLRDTDGVIREYKLGTVGQFIMGWYAHRTPEEQAEKRVDLREQLEFTCRELVRQNGVSLNNFSTFTNVRGEISSNLSKDTLLPLLTEIGKKMGSFEDKTLFNTHDRSLCPVQLLLAEIMRQVYTFDSDCILMEDVRLVAGDKSTSNNGSKVVDIVGMFFD